MTTGITTTRIDRLTSADLALLPVVRDEWLDVGLRTGPADRERALEGVRLAYRAVGLREPGIVIWLNSPLAGSIATAMLAQVGDQVGDQVWAQVGEALYYSAGYGQHDAAWLAFYDTFGRMGLPCVDRLNGLMLVARSAGWWVPFRNGVI